VQAARTVKIQSTKIPVIKKPCAQNANSTTWFGQENLLIAFQNVSYAVIPASRHDVLHCVVEECYTTGTLPPKQEAIHYGAVQ
jgi:hypothetical protein